MARRIELAGIAAMLAPGLFVWANFVDVPKDAAVFRGRGPAVALELSLPAEGRRPRTVDARHVSDQNPFGINPDDPNGRDDVLVASPEVHLPPRQAGQGAAARQGRPAQFRGASVPGQDGPGAGLVTYIWFTPTRIGKFDLLCNELCGVGHFVMRGKVRRRGRAGVSGVVEQSADLRAAVGASGRRGAWGRQGALCGVCRLPRRAGGGQPCAACAETDRPRDWYLARQLKITTRCAGHARKDVFGKMMAPMAATLADDAAIANVVAYIGTLPDRPAPATVAGRANKGQGTFVTCANCHGPGGRGLHSTNAPALAGMSDWYLVTQLRNFRQGIRGTHPKDMYGPQMVSMAAFLADDQAIDDLVAYIDTLR